MLGKVLGIATLAAFVLLSAIMQVTSPSTIHPLGILAVFILLYLLALGTLTFLLVGIHRVIVAFMPSHRKGKHFTVQTAYYYASVLALAPVMIIGMRSIGRSGLYDVALVVVFELVACFYISKRR